MKAAIVLVTGADAMAQQAGEIDAVLASMIPAVTRADLWLVCPEDRAPESLPEMCVPFTKIQRIAVARPHVPEVYLALLEQRFRRDPVDFLFFAGDGLGEELATRLGYRLNGSACLQVNSCRITTGKPEVTKPAYGSHLRARFRLERMPYCLSVAKQAGRPAKLIPANGLGIEPIVLDGIDCPWIQETVVRLDPPDTGLAGADRVLAVGQGAKNKETVDRLQRIASAMGAELGASRPVVMNAWTDMRRLIGVSGVMLSPKLCIAAGVSGMPVFNVGIQNSEFIVAINTDGDAPIFRIADVGIVGDLLEVLTELETVITEEKSMAKNTESRK